MTPNAVAPKDKRFPAICISLGIQESRRLQSRGCWDHSHLEELHPTWMAGGLMLLLVGQGELSSPSPGAFRYSLFWLEVSFLTREAPTKGDPSLSQTGLLPNSRSLSWLTMPGCARRQLLGPPGDVDAMSRHTGAERGGEGGTQGGFPEGPPGCSQSSFLLGKGGCW